VTAAEAILGHAGPLDREGEEVAGVVARRVKQRVEQLLLAGTPLDVDVFRAPRPRGQPQVKGEASLQEPLTVGDGDQSGEQAVEGDALTVAREPGTVPAGPVLQPLLERLPKRGCVFVFHAGTSSR